MGWANHYIEKLLNGETVQFRPKGNSMLPKIKSGQLCTVIPITTELEVGDVVLCKVKGNQYLHLISAKKHLQYQISNNNGFVNGWITINNIYGKLIKIED
jgi:hypothetical protein